MLKLISPSSNSEGKPTSGKGFALAVITISPVVVSSVDMTDVPASRPGRRSPKSYFSGNVRKPP